MKTQIANVTKIASASCLSRIASLAALLLLLSLGSSAQPARGLKISEKVNPGVDLDIYLSTTIGGNHVTLVQPDGTPWHFVVGANGIGSLDLPATITVRVKGTDDIITMPSSLIEDFDQYFKGDKLRRGPQQPSKHIGSSIQVMPDAQAALMGAFLGTNSPLEFLPLSPGLPSAPGFLPAPDFMADLNGDGVITAADNIYAAVNLSLWAPVAQSFPLLTEFSITDGTSTVLPGYYFSLTPITFDPSNGYTSDEPLTGDVYYVAEHDLSSTPEPSSLFLFGSGVVGLSGFLRKLLLS